MSKTKKTKLSSTVTTLSFYTSLRVIACLSLVFLVACGSKAPQMKASSKLKLGPQTPLSQLEFDQAQSIINDALELKVEGHKKSRGIYDKQVSKLINRGRSQLKKKKFDEALKDFQKAYKLSR